MKFTYKNIKEEKIVQGIKGIRNSGGEIDNTEFSIKGVSGTWKYDSETLTIDVIDKPWLASWEMIENKLNEFFR